ncbi:MAG: TetR family transcriptional regulator [Deltaproteobacteria bacterium]|nr:TetR family transcriptional regulator [Deltaproteobacteria bacterium]
MAPPNPAELQWVRAPQQARSHDTLARLLDAAEAMLEEAPWDQCTVAALVARGRSSIGAFYARFPDKDSLLQHLHQRRSTDGVHTADAALASERWAGVPIEPLIRAVVAFVAQDYVDHAGLHREIVRRNSTDARFRERSAHVAGHVVRLMALLLEERRQEIDVDDTLRAADMLHRILYSVLDQSVQFVDRPPGPVALTPPLLVEAIVRAMLGYLGVRAASPRGKP